MTTTFSHILNDAEIKIALKIIRGGGENGDSIAATIDRRLITPNIERINKATGQQNDSRYLAYVVEHLLTPHA